VHFPCAKTYKRHFDGETSGLDVTQFINAEIIKKKNVVFFL